MIPAHNHAMVLRIVWLAFIVVSVFALAGCPPSRSGSEKNSNESAGAQSAAARPTEVAGYYRLDDPAQYGAKSMKEVPIGQVRYLGIEEGRWILRDMMVGFGGTWVKTANGAQLTITEGPSGPTKGNETFEAIRTETGLTLRTSKGKAPDLAFTFVNATAPAGFGYDEFLGPKK